MSTLQPDNHKYDETKSTNRIETRPKRKSRISFRRSTSGYPANSYEKNFDNPNTVSRTRSNASEGVSRHKLVMIGDSGVGKSCLLEKLLDRTSANAFISTIGVDLKHLLIKTVYGRLVRLEIWDTGGQQRYRPVLSSCYRKAVGIIAVFDVTSKRSFTNLNQWMLEVDEFVSFLAMKENTPKLLLGNKCDLTDRRQVEFETASQFARDRGMIYVETSAIKETSLIQEAFLALVQAVDLSQLSQ